MAERLYSFDSFSTTFDARVADIREVARTAGQTVWHIALDRTAFYPTSGGQPHDTGVLQAKARSGAVLDVPIDAVEEDEDGELWHATTKPVNPGTEVRGVIDWPRRLDHMQQHSGQHLLSAVFSRELAAHTVSFHLGEEVSTIDLAGAALSTADLERVERVVNEIIAEDRPVTVRTVSRAEAEAMLARGELRKLPERAGEMRLIEIDGWDLNACGGTHVRSTGQVGGLLLRGTEKVRQGLRVEFVAGLRAARSARTDFAALTRAGAVLSVGRGDVPEAIERLQAEARSLAKDRKRLRESVAGYHAAKLVAESPREGDGPRVIALRTTEEDAEYVKLVASRIAAGSAGTVALLASTQREPAAVVLARSADLAFSSGAILKAALADLGLRGGGSAEMAQGQAPAAALDGLFAAVIAAVRAG